jgi:hypothetical protein
MPPVGFDFFFNDAATPEIYTTGTGNRNGYQKYFLGVKAAGA